MSEETNRRGPGRPRKEKKRERKYGRVTVLLPPDLVEALDREAEAEGAESRSDIIRKFCQAGLQRREKRRAYRGADQG